MTYIVKSRSSICTGRTAEDAVSILIRISTIIDAYRFAMSYIMDEFDFAFLTEETRKLGNSESPRDGIEHVLDLMSTHRESYTFDGIEVTYIDSEKFEFENIEKANLADTPEDAYEYLLNAYTYGAHELTEDDEIIFDVDFRKWFIAEMKRANASGYPYDLYSTGGLLEFVDKACDLDSLKFALHEYISEESEEADKLAMMLLKVYMRYN